MLHPKFPAGKPVCLLMLGTVVFAAMFIEQDPTEKSTPSSTAGVNAKSLNFLAPVSESFKYGVIIQ